LGRGRATIFGLTASAFVLGAAAPAFAGNLLTNGSFDDVACGLPYCNYGTVADFPVPAGFGWSVPVNNVDVVPGPGTWGTPADGRQMLDLVGYGSTGAISQTVATTAGKHYVLTFQYANNPFSGTGSADVDVTGGSSLLSDSVTHGGSSPSNLDWKSFYGTFVADGSSATLLFNETVGGGNGGVFLDDVSLSAAPEPTVWGMFVIGIGALGATLRVARRSKSLVATV
jgi:hypothetical protein